MLGVQPVRGRTLTTEDDRPDAPGPPAVLNERFWQERFGADPRIVGRTLRLNRQSYTVVGIVARKHSTMRRFFEVDVFVPMSSRQRLTGESLANPESRQYFMLGRLRPGTSIEQAQARMRVAAAVLPGQDPKSWGVPAGQRAAITVVSERDSRVPPSARLGVLAFLAFLQAMVGIVLLITCASLANLSLAQTLAREKEIAVRLAIGSTRWRLIRQLLVESVFVAVPACGAALLLTRWLLRSLSAVDLRAEVSVYLDLGIDQRVLLFALLLTAVTAVLFSLAPALAMARTNVLTALKNTGAGPSGRGSRLRSGLIVVEVAMSVVLLLPAGLFVRSLLNINKVDLGFDARNLALVSVSLDPDRYDAPRGVAAYRQMLERVRSLPGVIGADVAAVAPLSGVVNADTFRPADAQQTPRSVSYNLVAEEYFAALDIPVLEGRGFAASDGPGRPQVAVVNRAFARAFWPDRNAIGKRIVSERQPTVPIEIVGVVTTGKYDSVTEADTPYLYRPIAQEYVPAAILHVRTRTDPAALLHAIALAAQSVDPGIPVFDLSTMERQLMLSIGPFQAIASILSFFGLVGLIVASLGLYGVISYATLVRRREIAIRIAVGADRGAILKLLVGQGVWLLGIGMAVGLPLSMGVALLISNFLFGISPTDALTCTLVPALLGSVAMAAVCLAAIRGTRTPPFEALHSS